MWPGTPPIPTEHGITRKRFEQEIVPAGRPVVLRGLVRDWDVAQAAGKGVQMLFKHLSRRANKQPVQAWFGAPVIAGQFGYSDDLSGFNHERRLVPVAELLNYLLANADDASAYSAYAGGIPVAKHLPDLLSQLPMSLLEEGREMLVSLWLGNRTRTAAHWDVPQNLACVVLGHRRFTLLPPDQVANLYVGPLDFTLAGQPISLVDFANPDFDRHPKFRKAMASAMVAELEPGDALYIPSLWWHHVESLDAIGAMINFWWRDGPDYLMTPLLTLFHALLTLRELPEIERSAWRGFFDHYIFEANGDPMEHLPPSARGVFGAMTPDLVRQLKTMLAGSLQP